MQSVWFPAVAAPQTGSRPPVTAIRTHGCWNAPLPSILFRWSLAFLLACDRAVASEAAVPQAVGSLIDQAGGDVFEGVLVPRAVLGKGLQGLPVLGPVQADERLGDGVLLDVEGQAGKPLGEELEAAVGEGGGAGAE